MAFAKKLIEVEFILENGVFEGGGNSLTVSGLRTSCKISKVPDPSSGLLELEIFGLPLSAMNQLTQFGNQLNLLTKNTIIVSAGEEGSSLSLVFKGTIGRAWTDAAGMPDVAFRVLAYPLLYGQVAPAAPTSINGSADVGTLLSGFASQMGFSWENSISNPIKLSNPYFCGSLWGQARACAKAAGVEVMQDSGTIAAWNPGQGRSGDATLISKSTILVGYPAFASYGVVLKTLFDPTLRAGGKIMVQSDLTPACGNWVILSLDLDLESWIPNGNWFATIAASTLNVPEPQ